MRALYSFLLDRSLVSALALILAFEVGFQAGCYAPLLSKNSYAKTIQSVIEKSLASHSELKPNTIILGTSIAYESISLSQLNYRLKDSGFIVQSLAIPGSELIVQELILREYLSKHPNIRYVIHINELPLAWINRKQLIPSTLSMLGEFDRSIVFERIKSDLYETTFWDYLNLTSKWVAYRKDMADLFLRPDKRWKEWINKKKENPSSLYLYENQYVPSLALYQFTSLEECIGKTTPYSPIPDHSNKFHLSALGQTCSLLFQNQHKIEKTPETQVFGTRLSNLYSYLKSQKIAIINVYPPVSNFLNQTENQARKAFWKSEYGHLLQNHEIDLSTAIPLESNDDFYYDLIHVNRKGMVLFTEALAKELLTLPIRSENAL